MASKKTVLVVDDVAFVRKTLSDIFIEAGYQIVGEAADGARAVELYRQVHPDLVTMDIVMPTLSGIEATRNILAFNKDAKIIMISAMGQENLVMEAINVGAKDYILKPFSAEEILKTTDRVLNADEKLSQKLSVIKQQTA